MPIWPFIQFIIVSFINYKMFFEIILKCKINIFLLFGILQLKNIGFSGGIARGFIWNLPSPLIIWKCFITYKNNMKIIVEQCLVYLPKFCSPCNKISGFTTVCANIYNLNFPRIIHICIVACIIIHNVQFNYYNYVCRLNSVEYTYTYM